MSQTWTDHLWPRDASRREAKRLEIYEREILAASHRALRIGLSLRCARGDHGCLNDGSRCICICHDTLDRW